MAKTVRGGFLEREVKNAPASAPAPEPINPCLVPMPPGAMRAIRNLSGPERGDKAFRVDPSPPLERVGTQHMRANHDAATTHQVLLGLRLGRVRVIGNLILQPWRISWEIFIIFRHV